MEEQLQEWQKLCKQASVEKDPKKLADLIRQINERLAAKQERLNRASQTAKSADA